MRPLLISVAAAFALICFGQDEIPANKPASPQPGETGRLPSHVKLFEGFASDAKPFGDWKPASPQPGEAGKLPGDVKLFGGIARGVRPFGALVAGPRTVARKVAPVELVPQCGHILVEPVAPQADPGFVIKLPANGASRMPVYKGLPPCSAPND